MIGSEVSSSDASRCLPVVVGHVYSQRKSLLTALAVYLLHWQVKCKHYFCFLFVFRCLSHASTRTLQTDGRIHRLPVLKVHWFVSLLWATAVQTVDSKTTEQCSQVAEFTNNELFFEHGWLGAIHGERRVGLVVEPRVYRGDRGGWVEPV